MNGIRWMRAADSSGTPARTDSGLYVLSFVVVLLVALLAQLLLLKWRPWFPGSESEQSLIGGVRAGVYTFMSHLN
jgi:light-harvesting complex 1 beta chain